MHETTEGHTRSVRDYRGKPVLVMVESWEVALQNPNAKLRDRLTQIGMQNQDLAKYISIVPAVGLWEFTGTALTLKKSLIRGIAKQSRLEIWFDTDQSILKLIQGNSKLSSVGILNAAGDLVWAWRGVVPVEDLISQLRGQIQKTFPGASLPA